MTREEQERQKLDERIEAVSRKYANSPVPVAILDRSMAVRWKNAAFGKLFPNDGELKEELRRLGYFSEKKMEALKKSREASLTLRLEQDGIDKKRNGKLRGRLFLLDMDEGDFCGMQLVIRDALAKQSVSPEELKYGGGFQSYMMERITQIYVNLKKMSQMKDLPPDICESLKCISEETWGIERVTKDFCRMVDAEHGIHSSKPMRKNVAAELRTLCQRLEQTGKKIETPFTYTRPEERSVLCNMNLLKEAVEELAANAFRYARGSRVHLEAEYRDSKIWVTVTDDGIGRMKEEAEKVLIPFFSYDPEMAENQAGGMGLPSIYALIKLEDGEMGVDFRAGNGTRAWFFLPYKEGIPELWATLPWEKDFDERTYLLRMLPIEGPPDLFEQER